MNKLRAILLLVLLFIVLWTTGCRIQPYNESYAAGVVWRAGNYTGYVNCDRIDHQWKARAWKTEKL